MKFAPLKQLIEAKRLIEVACAIAIAMPAFAAPTSTTLPSKIGAPASASPNKTESFKPYFSNGGVIGNGGDQLKLTPEGSDDSDTVVELPDSIKNYGFIRIDGENPEGVTTGFGSFTLSKCNGGKITDSGHYVGGAGACSGYQNNSSESFSVSLNEKLRLPPGLYALSSYGMSTEDRSVISTTYHPAIIRIEKRKTTIVPLPRIVLPAAPGDLVVDVEPDLSKKSFQSLLVYSTWIRDTGNTSTCSRPLRIRQNPYIWNWVDEGPIREKFDKHCRIAKGSSWKSMFPYWQFQKTDPKKNYSYTSEYVFRLPMIDNETGEFHLKYSGFHSWGNLASSVQSGSFVSTFPGIYRLRFHNYQGVNEYKSGVVTGGFTEEMIGKIFPEMKGSK